MHYCAHLFVDIRAFWCYCVLAGTTINTPSANLLYADENGTYLNRTLGCCHVCAQMSIGVLKIGGDNQKLYPAFVQHRQKKGVLTIIKIDAEFKSLIPPLTPDERITHAQDIDNLPMLEALESAREQILEAKRKEVTK